MISRECRRKQSTGLHLVVLLGILGWSCGTSTDCPNLDYRLLQRQEIHCSIDSDCGSGRCRSEICNLPFVMTATQGERDGVMDRLIHDLERGGSKCEPALVRFFGRLSSETWSENPILAARFAELMVLDPNGTRRGERLKEFLEHPSPLVANAAARTAQRLYPTKQRPTDHEFTVLARNEAEILSLLPTDRRALLAHEDLCEVASTKDRSSLVRYRALWSICNSGSSCEANARTWSSFLSRWPCHVPPREGTPDAR